MTAFLLGLPLLPLLGRLGSPEPPLLAQYGPPCLLLLPASCPQLPVPPLLGSKGCVERPLHLSIGSSTVTTAYLSLTKAGNCDSQGGSHCASNGGSKQPSHPSRGSTGSCGEEAGSSCKQGQQHCASNGGSGELHHLGSQSSGRLNKAETSSLVEPVLSRLTAKCNNKVCNLGFELS